MILWEKGNSGKEKKGGKSQGTLVREGSQTGAEIRNTFEDHPSLPLSYKKKREK